MASGIVRNVIGLAVVFGFLDCVTVTYPYFDNFNMLILNSRISSLSEQAMWSEFELNKVTDYNGTTSLPIFFGIRAKRIKKGTYGLAGTVTVTDDAFDGYDVC